LLLACGGSVPKKMETSASSQPVVAEAPRARDADDLARFLAGMPGKPGSPFSGQEDLAAWKTHRRELDAAWDGIGKKSLPAMQEFQTQELAAAGKSLVFYPFSGPDTLMLTIFFPHSPTYVMVGLEPAGTLPTPAQFTKGDLNTKLARERVTVSDVLRSSFFITRQMDHQFRGQVTDGLLLPMLHLLVRTGHTILGYRYVRLDDQGRVIDRATNYHAPGRIGNKGVQIDFSTDADQSEHKLFYFSVNLSDERLRENRPFLQYVASLDGMTSYFKATSYMTHKPEFSVIRDQVLAHSTAVLQDDSGIPYHYFVPASWRVQLYGDYRRPYGSFHWLVQPDLRQAYDKPGTKALAFRIGYGYGKVASNLLLATRVKE
jgi:hypothetical protein